MPQAEASGSRQGRTRALLRYQSITASIIASIIAGVEGVLVPVIRRTVSHPGIGPTTGPRGLAS